ncbi:hypothetical protein [Longitalea arenae]|uniref:hypothetical protein n=1 Tax=Longitalea arenae TaxID=2812558 RepID=UPI001968335D|nr:hypothetical protein [Longitalea arenae]
MKKYSFCIALACLLACNSNNEETKEAPGAIENTTQHPNGITGGSVISRDTGAMVTDSMHPRDSMPPRK